MQYKVEKHMTDNLPTYWISISGRMETHASAYLMQLKKQNKSPNTIKRYAWSICYMLNYLSSIEISLEELTEKNYHEQVDILKGFLYWIKDGKHKYKTRNKPVKNKTCNDHLRDFIQYYEYLTQYEDYPELQVLRKRVGMITDTIGLSRKTVVTVFDYYLDEKEDEQYKAHIVTDEEEEQVLAALKNLRDVALISLLRDTGIRIGEALGTQQEDLHLDKQYITVQFRSDNQNGARAKRGQYRKAYFSKTTKDALAAYMDKFSSLLGKTNALFVTLQGARKGKPMRKGDVDSLMRRIEEKTGIHLYSHLLRHRFADKRDGAGWDMLTISKALGHKHLGTTEKYLSAAVVKCEEKQNAFFAEQDTAIDIDWLLE